jgi:hypothetical protein
MRCTLFVLPVDPDDDLSLAKRDFAATSEPLHLALERGLPVRGGLELPPEATRIRVRAVLGGSAYVYGKVVGGSRYEIVGVPAGPCEVEAWCDTPTGAHRGAASATAGGTADVALRKLW